MGAMHRKRMPKRSAPRYTSLPRNQIVRAQTKNKRKKDGNEIVKTSVERAHQCGRRQAGRRARDLSEGGEEHPTQAARPKQGEAGSEPEKCRDATSQRRGRRRQRSAESQVDVGEYRRRPGTDLAWKNSVGQCGHRQNKTYERPDAPTSKSARAVRIGERIRMKAPKVPISDGKGMKKG